jgi:hypothetical protein
MPIIDDNLNYEANLENIVGEFILLFFEGSLEFFCNFPFEMFFNEAFQGIEHLEIFPGGQHLRLVVNFLPRANIIGELEILELPAFYPKSQDELAEC